jgi:hypothetical protein
VISKQTLTFGIYFATTSKIGEKKICQLALDMFIYRMCKDCNFDVDCEELQSGLNPTT